MGEMTIEELAVAAEMSARNVRLYQTREMIDPPQRRGRKAVYSQRHLEQLQTIRRLLRDGMTRELIKRVVRRDDEEIDRFLGLQRVVTGDGAASTESELFSPESLVAVFGEDLDALQHALRIGMLRSTKDGQLEAPIPGLIDRARDARATGIPTAAMLEVLEYAQDQVDAAARFFVDVMRRHVWEPFEERGRPDEEWQAMAATFEDPERFIGPLYATLFSRALVEQARLAANDVLARAIED